MKVFSREEWQILRFANLCWIYKIATKRVKKRNNSKKKKELKEENA